jgi:hypothetical protein
MCLYLRAMSIVVRLVLVLLFFGHVQYVTSQVTSKPSKHRGNLNCFYQEKYSAAERNNFYPFNVDTIKLVSFRYHESNYPVRGDTILIDSLIDIKTLTKAERNELTDILYNNFYRRDPNYGISNQCFIPRNAILFLDKYGHLSNYILLCFHCDTHQESSKKINFGDECLQKMEKLRQFFITTGVKFGTDITVQMYSGETF